MAEHSQKGKKPKIFVAAVFMVAVGICLAVGAAVFRDDLIILYRLKGYQMIRNMIVLYCIFAVGVMVFSVIRIGRLKKRKNEEELELSRIRQDREDRNRKSEAYLSVSDKLDSSFIQSLLENKAREEWSVLDVRLFKVKEQLQEMDDCQSRLSRLLTDNGATALNSTQEVLDKVEQYLCKNVRKCLNYMGVADPHSRDDIALVGSKLDSCYQDNQEKLAQIDEFLRTVVEYLNRQGDEEAESSIDLLNMYKKTILESIAGNY